MELGERDSTENFTMDPKRITVYQELESKIGDTPLREYWGQVPNSNRIFIKDETANPYGSHYDRVSLRLFRHYEGLGKINPSRGVFETTTGSAGISFAGIGKELGYECHVAIPDGGEQARVEAIKALGATVYLTPAEDYVAAFPKWSKNFYKRTRNYPLNHSMGKDRRNNEVTLSALEGIAYEAIDQLRSLCTPPDYFIPAIGNGSSVLGPGRVFKCEILGIKIVGFETFQSAHAFEKMWTGKYETEYGIKPGTLTRHRVPGTSFPGIDFPHLRNAIKDKVLDDVVLISDAQMNEEYKRLTGRKAPTLPQWDTSIEDNYYNTLGRSTRAGINVVLSLAEKDHNKSFVVIAYDKANRYNS